MQNGVGFPFSSGGCGWGQLKIPEEFPSRKSEKLPGIAFFVTSSIFIQQA